LRYSLHESPLEGTTGMNGGQVARRNLDAPELCPGFPLPRIREDRPRFPEDKLRGNDPPEADRESEDAHVS